ncbi:hypothetical protein BMI86_10190 [Thioclava sp. DLFJ5-1]|nr:hypothetical protein BMI86_10190 [Thioclava sp. DLFJ5-1]
MARQIAKNRERGTLSGFPDFVVLLPDGMAIFIEVKAPTGGKLSKDQSELRRDLELMGFRYAVVRSVDELDAALRSWGFIT